MSIVTQCSLCRFGGVHFIAAGLTSGICSVLGKTAEGSKEKIYRTISKVTQVAIAALCTCLIFSNWIVIGIAALTVTAFAITQGILNYAKKPIGDKESTEYKIVKNINRVILIAAKIANVIISTIVGMHLGYMLGNAATAALGGGIALGIAAIPYIFE